MKIMFLTQVCRQFHILCLAVAFLSAPAGQASLPALASPPVIDQPPSLLTAVQPLLAQSGTIEQAVEGFFRFLRIIITIVAVVMCLWAGILIHDGKLREGIYALVGAFLLLIARLVVNSLANAAL
jgi:hypothetical protein